MAYLLLGITKISGWDSGDLEVDVAAGCGPGISASEVSLNSHSAKRATTTGRKLSQFYVFYRPNMCIELQQVLFFNSLKISF